MHNESLIKSPSEAANEELRDHTICKLCQRQFAKYTCPKCNAPYCSLTCFRSETHIGCSESFYKAQLEADIHSETSKSAQERKKMLDLLRKFEEDATDQVLDDKSSDEDEDDTSALVKQLEGVDLASIPANTLWEILPLKKRRQFLGLFADTSSQLATRLLGNAALEQEIVLPWWEKPELSADGLTVENGLPPRQYGSEPNIIDVPPSLIKSASAGQPLIFNLAAICFAYAYVTRRLGSSPIATISLEDPSHSEAIALMGRLVPFLIERQSTTLYQSMDEVITGVWSHFHAEEMTDEIFALLSKDVATLLQPHVVTEIERDPTNQAPGISKENTNRTSLLVLSDLFGLFSQHADKSTLRGGSQGRSKAQAEHIKRKLLFYAAKVLSTPNEKFKRIGFELMHRTQNGEGGLVWCSSRDNW